MLNGNQLLLRAMSRKAKKPYEAKWAGSEERISSLQRVVPICSLSKEEYGRTYKSEIIAMTRVKTTVFSCRHSSLR